MTEEGVPRGRVVFYLLVGLIVAWSIGPIVWNVVVSVTPEIDLLQRPPNISPRNMSLESYQALLSSGGEAGGGGSSRESRDFRAGLKNSIIVSSIVTLFGTMISIVSGYAFARYRFVGRQAILVAIILTMPIPIVVIAIPLIRLMSTLQLMDSYLGLSLLYLSFSVPLTTWVSASFIRTIPREIEEAAYVDGASRFRAFISIILPLCLPVMGAVAIIFFLSAWNQFFLPLIFAPAHAKQLTVVVTEFIGKDFIDKDLLAAAGMIAIIPPALLVIFLNKYIVGGLVQGAVK